MKKLVFALFAIAVVASLAAPATAGRFNKVLNIGDQAPDWSSLPGTDDKEHSLADYKDAKAVVLVFTCNQCPVAVAYEDRLVQLQADYEDKGVKVVAINVNPSDAEKMPAMKQRAERKGFNFPYLYDDSQKSARDCGAAKTPEIVLLNGEGKVVYLGAIDDNMNPSEVSKTYLRTALDEVLAGKSVSNAETRAEGCGIKYEN
jgi:peroxiredoxin